MKKKYSIAFIFIEEIHHLYHFITVAIELSKKHQVHILTFTNQNRLLENTLNEFNGNKVIVERRSTQLFRAFTDKLKNRKHPRAGFWMKKNKNYILKNFDAVIFTDYNHHKLLKARTNKNWPKFIKFPHGIAGRKYVFNRDLLDFDLHVIFGEFYVKELEKRSLLKDFALIGYPKNDIVKQLDHKKIFKNNKPTVLYNPHFTAPFSSWHAFGLEILEYFYNQKKFNLIFAPHINLFNKRGGKSTSIITEKYYKSEQIFIDLGSEKSVDMTYVKNADIYLGDVSSQVYEFILEPKPTIFINTTKVDYKKKTTYRFWQCGQVINKPSELKSALLNAFTSFPEYKYIQEKINVSNIYTEEGSTPSEKAAIAIVDYLKKTKRNL